MPSLNKVLIMGNLTRDVELRTLQSGMSVAEIGLAINDRKKNKQTDQWEEETTFVDVTVWGRTAEVAAEYLEKGSPVLFEGRLKFEQWEKDGQKRSKLKVTAERLTLLGTGNRGGGGGSQSKPNDDPYGQGVVTPPEDDIPF